MIVVAGFITLSCSRDDENPPAPSNENNTLGHDRWGKVELIFRKGHLHGKDFHGNVDGDDPYFKGTQKVIFETDDNMNIVRKNENGKILTKEEEPILMMGHLNYSLEIIYYNKAGERINAQFATPGMAPIHQHFFRVTEYTDLNTKETKTPENDELMDYLYRDTNPEDVMIGTFKTGTTTVSKLTNDPIGLKGYFTHKRGRTKYMMNIFLAHLL
ncbi:MAG: hypothetical protein Q4G08_08960, partial [Capnocytophaga sp.]|nr:hypothetical protein [Capnocytophaga sp.]